MKITPIFCRIIMTVWIAFMLIGCQSKTWMNWDPDRSLIDYLTDKQKLTFNTQNFAPFSYLIKGKVEGPVVEIIQQACEEANLDCKFQLLDWATAQKQVKEDEADGLFVIGWNARRTQWLHYSDPLIETEYGFFSPKNANRNYKKLKDFEGRKVAVYGPSNTSVSLNRLNSQLNSRIKIALQPNTDAVFRQLVSDRSVNAAYSNRDTGRAHLARMGMKNVAYVKSHKKLLYYVGISKNVPLKIVNRFNLALRKLHRDGSVQEILGLYGLTAAASEACTASLRNTSASLDDSEIASMRSGISEKLYAHENFNNLSCDYLRRFESMDLGDITDNATGLVWQNPKYIEVRTWDQAMVHINRLNKVVYGDHSDWRLPTIEELESILRYGQYGNNPLISRITKHNALPFWSADKVQSTTNVWTVDFLNNVIAPVHPGEVLPLIAVRSAQ